MADEPEGTAGDGGEGEGRTFTQADVDRIVQDRVARARAGSKLPADYDVLRAKAARVDEVVAAHAAELGKAQDAAAEAAARVEAAEAKAVKAARERAVIAAASAPVNVGDRQLRFVRPDVAVRFVPDDVDPDNGVAVNAALAAVLTEHPYLADAGQVTPVGF